MVRGFGRCLIPQAVWDFPSPHRSEAARRKGRRKMRAGQEQPTHCAGALGTDRQCRSPWGGSRPQWWVAAWAGPALASGLCVSRSLVSVMRLPFAIVDFRAI